jgi:hypothetical protein
VSLLDAELLQDVTFLTGGYPAPFINRTSSVLQVSSARAAARSSAGGRRSALPAPAPFSKGPSAPDTQQFGEQQGIFPILGFDWRFKTAHIHRSTLHVDCHISRRRRSGAGASRAKSTVRS